MIAAMQRSGASVNVSDPRVTAVQTWIIAAVGAGLIGAAGWVGSAITDLKLAVQVGTAQLQASQRAIEDHEQRLRNVERRP